jgi:hypothetical protein
MRRNISSRSQAGSASNWEQLFECALVELDPVVRERRLQNAKDAIMDRIEDSFDTVTCQESQSLIGALKAISEIQRVEKTDDSRRPGHAQTFSNIAGTIEAES